MEDVSAPLDLRVVPSVSDWLDSIRSSQAVCTDSFHGMAFQSSLENRLLLLSTRKEELLDSFRF